MGREFTGSVPEKLLPDMIGTTAEAGDEDVGIDEAGHLRAGIKGFHGGGKDTLRGTKGRVVDGTESRQPLGGVGSDRNLAASAAELLGGPVRQWLVVMRREGIKPPLQPVIKIQDESAHGWQSSGIACRFKDQSRSGGSNAWG